THDSIGLGEDGPTHQPIEHLSSYRAMPNMTLIRPADANETVEAWKVALRHKGGPVMLALSRQGLPVIDRKAFGPASGVKKGGYVLRDTKGKPDVILISSGSEVSLCLDAAEALLKRNVKARVVSMASMELFEAQPVEYRRSVLPPSVTKRIAVEAAVTFGWEKYVGLEGRVMGIDTFGESAPAGDIYKHFGLTVENIVKVAAALRRRR
ncbi:MAG TPA: transketolase, partial [Nitrospirae bacterium]|nr:transketolase [Nitrospirota bacterium]